MLNLLPTQAAWASPSPQPAPTLSAPTVGLAVSSGGWIDYTDPITASLASAATSTQVVSGTRDSSGACDFQGSDQLSAGAQSVFDIETAFNPGTCQERMALGPLTATAESDLAEAPPAGTTQSESNIAKVPHAAADGSEASLADPTETGHQKTEWIDPLGITINSVADNLTWSYNGATWTSASATADSYEFPYDGWSNSGLPPITFLTPGDGSIYYEEVEHFVNIDFELLVVALFGPAGYAACGFDSQPAYFTLSPAVRGYGNGDLGGSYGDSVSGGCSDLVHHGSELGFGSIS